MINLQVIRTTDGKFVGNIFEFPSLPKPGWEVPAGDFNFEVLFVKKIRENVYSFKNFNYEVIAEIIGE